MAFYLRIEGVNLDSVLTDTPQVSVVRGASYLLRKLTKELPSMIKGWGFPEELSAISVGASIGLYECQSEINNLPSRIHEKLKEDENFQYFTFVIDAIPILNPNKFRQNIDELTTKNRLQQMRLPSLSLASLHLAPSTEENATEPCDWNGILPATPKNKEGTAEKDLSKSVSQRYKAGKDLRQKFYQREAGEQFTEDNGYCFTDELNQLSDDPEKGNLHNKMAVIYLDGNRFGKIQRNKCTSKDTQKAFDEEMQTLRSKYLADFLLYIKDKEDYRYLYHDKVTGKDITQLRLEVLLWGGDEILLVVPAWCGLDALSFFFQQSKDWKYKKTPLTHAGGLVFANRKTPLSRLVEQTKNLAQEVKDKLAGASLQNGFDYLVLESTSYPTESSLSKYRQKVFGEQLATSYSVLSPIKPDTLLETSKLKAISKSQLYGLARSIYKESLTTNDSDEETTSSLDPKSQALYDRMKTVVGEEIVQSGENAAKLLFTDMPITNGDSTNKWTNHKASTPQNRHPWYWLHAIELWDYLETNDYLESDDLKENNQQQEASL